MTKRSKRMKEVDQIVDADAGALDHGAVLELDLDGLVDELGEEAVFLVFGFPDSVWIVMNYLSLFLLKQMTFILIFPFPKNKKRNFYKPVMTLHLLQI